MRRHLHDVEQHRINVNTTSALGRIDVDTKLFDVMFLLGNCLVQQKKLMVAL